MIEYEQMDQTMLAVMEIYRQQVTGLKEQIASLKLDADYQRDEVERQKNRVTQAEDSSNRWRDQAAEKDRKITKLEGIISSLKIELQDERAAHTATKEQGDEGEAHD